MAKILTFSEWPDVSVTPMKDKKDISAGRLVKAEKKCPAQAKWEQAGGRTAMGDAAKRGMGIHEAIECWYAGTYTLGEVHHYKHKNKKGEVEWEIDVVLTDSMVKGLPSDQVIVDTERRISDFKIKGVPKNFHIVIDAEEKDTLHEWKTGKIYPEHVRVMEYYLRVTGFQRGFIHYLDIPEQSAIEVKTIAKESEMKDAYKRLTKGEAVRGDWCKWCKLKDWCPAWNAKSDVAEELLDAKYLVELFKKWKKQVSDTLAAVTEVYEGARIRAVKELKDDMHRESLGTVNKKTDKPRMVPPNDAEEKYPSDKNPELYDWGFKPTKEILKETLAKLEEQYPREKYPDLWEPTFAPDDKWIEAFGRQATADELGKVTVSLSKDLDYPFLDLASDQPLKDAKESVG